MLLLGIPAKEQFIVQMIVLILQRIQLVGIQEFQMVIMLTIRLLCYLVHT